MLSRLDLRFNAFVVFLVAFYRVRCSSNKLPLCIPARRGRLVEVGVPSIVGLANKMGPIRSLCGPTTDRVEFVRDKAVENFVDQVWDPQSVQRVVHRAKGGEYGGGARSHQEKRTPRLFLGSKYRLGLRSATVFQ